MKKVTSMDETSSLAIPVSSADHIQGDLKAPILLVEYGDYECPHCARALETVKALQEALGKKLCFVFRNFPLSQIHPYAEFGAEAAEAAGAQGRFWEMHEAIFQNQDSLGPGLITELAKELELDLPRFLSDLEGKKFEAKVREDFMGGARSGVHGTPSYFVNGLRYQGPRDSVETFVSALEALA